MNFLNNQIYQKFAAKKKATLKFAKNESKVFSHCAIISGKSYQDCFNEKKTVIVSSVNKETVEYVYNNKIIQKPVLCFMNIFEAK